MANQTKAGIDFIGANAANLRYIAVTVNAAGIAAGQTLTITLPSDLDSNFVPIELSHWRGAAGTWAPVAGAIAVTSYVPATRTLLLTAAGAGCNAADEIIILLAATDAAIA